MSLIARGPHHSAEISATVIAGDISHVGLVSVDRVKSDRFSSVTFAIEERCRRQTDSSLRLLGRRFRSHPRCEMIRLFLDLTHADHDLPDAGGRAPERCGPAKPPPLEAGTREFA